jgi:NAD(P)H-dependent FMN reductase
MNIVAFNGSPRKKGNTSLLLHELVRGVLEAGGQIEEIIAREVNIRPCRGCLKCNLLKRCSIKDDEWRELSEKILNADALVFASPVYFHHLPGPLKNILDRFRSFMHVRITENGLKHTPWRQWRKQFVLLLCQGSPDNSDAQPVIDLFTFITRVLGEENTLFPVVAKRLAVVNQVSMTEEELRILYQKLELPEHLVEQDYRHNQSRLKRCCEIGKIIMSNILNNKAFIYLSLIQIVLSCK